MTEIICMGISWAIMLFIGYVFGYLQATTEEVQKKIQLNKNTK